MTLGYEVLDSNCVVMIVVMEVFGTRRVFLHGGDRISVRRFSSSNLRMRNFLSQ